MVKRNAKAGSGWLNMKVSAGITEKARKIKLIAMDIDGVLTGGEIIVLDSGEELKIWNVRDRMGFHLIRVSGAPIKFAWITGRESKQVELRAKEIGIEKLIQGSSDKRSGIFEVMKKLNVQPEETLFIGDDLIDIPAMKEVGFAICPKDAHSDVKKVCDYVSSVVGGKGVLREVVELVLKSQKLWNKILVKYS